MRFDGKVAIITGANSGTGAATARMFVERGAKVFGIDIVTNYMEKLESESNGNFRFAKCDLSSSEEIAEAVEKAAEAYNGRMDILCNIAGISTDLAFSKLPRGFFEKVWSINLLSQYYLSKAVIPYMKKNIKAGIQLGGAIVCVSSDSAVYGTPRGCPYVASKAAVIGLSNSLGKELARFNIRCNCVIPGVVETPMTDSLNDAEKQAIANAIPIGHMAKPEEVANVIHFLASDYASHITAARINVDGGYITPSTIN